MLMVKHYFSANEAGWYTSMALIGRMIYFVTWMVVMVLIPKVVRLKKEGKSFKKPLLQYFTIIGGVSISIIVFAFLYPKFLVTTLFGEAYLPIAEYMWLYALATALFALANIFVYYFLSLDQYTPVYIAIGMGIVQVILLLMNQETLGQIIWLQLINMGIILGIQTSYFVLKK
jgi:O-antigen/teichoic acid export membrane protein